MVENKPHHSASCNVQSNGHIQMTYCSEILNEFIVLSETAWASCWFRKCMVYIDSNFETVGARGGHTNSTTLFIYFRQCFCLDKRKVKIQRNQ